MSIEQSSDLRFAAVLDLLELQSKEVGEWLAASTRNHVFGVERQCVRQCRRRPCGRIRSRDWLRSFSISNQERGP